MTTPALTLFERILFFLGFARSAPNGFTCSICRETKGDSPGASVSGIDLGDDDFICLDCWNKWQPKG